MKKSVDINEEIMENILDVIAEKADHTEKVRSTVSKDDVLEAIELGHYEEPSLTAVEAYFLKLKSIKCHYGDEYKLDMDSEGNIEVYSRHNENLIEWRKGWSKLSSKPSDKRQPTDKEKTWFKELQEYFVTGHAFDGGPRKRFSVPGRKLDGSEFVRFYKDNEGREKCVITHRGSRKDLATKKTEKSTFMIFSYFGIGDGEDAYIFKFTDAFKNTIERRKHDC